MTTFEQLRQELQRRIDLTEMRGIAGIRLAEQTLNPEVAGFTVILQAQVQLVRTIYKCSKYQYPVLLQESVAYLLTALGPYPDNFTLPEGELHALGRADSTTLRGLGVAIDYRSDRLVVPDTRRRDGDAWRSRLLRTATPSPGTPCLDLAVVPGDMTKTNRNTWETCAALSRGWNVLRDEKAIAHTVKAIRNVLANAIPLSDED